jgi:hypothetical protein
MNETCELCVIWPDGTWCFLSELSEMTDKSDDYIIVEYSEDLQ